MTHWRSGPRSRETSQVMGVAETDPGTVVVLGTGPLSVELEGLLVADGFHVETVPTTEVVPVDDLTALEDVLSELEHVGWIAVTSAAAAPIVAAALEGRQRPATLKVAAVGPATAAALRLGGVEVDLVGTGKGGAALGVLIGLPAWPGAEVVLPRSSIAVSEIDEVLRAAGHEVRPIVVYETRPRPLEPTARAVLLSAACVVAAAPSALTSLLAAGVHPRRVAAIGETTASAARTAGVAGVSVATSPTAGGLLGAVRAAFRIDDEGA